MSFCSGCGQQLADGVQFCNACGMPIGGRPQQKMGDDAGMRLLLPVGRSGWAIAAGYAGLLSFFLIFAPLALILGGIAAWHLKSNSELHGWGRTIFGLAMGAAGTILLLVLLLMS